MKASGIGRANGLDPARRRRAAEGAGGREFARLLDAGEAGALRAASAPGPAAALAAALAVEDALEGGGRARARARGEDLLERLDALRLDLLAGDVSPDRLRAVAAALAAPRAPSGDPRLDAVVAEIELRVEVELAKRGG